VKKDFKIYKGN